VPDADTPMRPPPPRVMAMAAPIAAQRERVSECVPGAVMACRLNRTQNGFRDWRSVMSRGPTAAGLTVGRGRVRPVVIDQQMIHRE